MANLIPNLLPESSKAPRGERELFEVFRKAEGADGWTVLHSYRLARHKSKVEGEIDFVLVIPQIGIVCIEVKSHERVTRKNGQWLNSRGLPMQDPFSQVSEAMYSLKANLVKKLNWLKEVPFLSLVWFTGCDVKARIPNTGEWEDHQLLDRKDLRGSVVEAITEVSQQGIERLVKRNDKFKVGAGNFTAKKAEEVVKKLRPEIDLRVSAEVLRNERNLELLNLIEEQYNALDAVQTNRAIVFTGQAGTGKTFLAMEVARRVSREGKSVALLCYNRNLAKDLTERMEGSDVEVSTVHSMMLRLTGMQIPDMRKWTATERTNFWHVDLPNAAVEKLLEGDFESVDCLVVDEAQDFEHAIYRDFFDLLLKGGLEEGEIRIFGDFENQAIFSRRPVKQDYLTSTNGCCYTLQTNCRNLPQIAKRVELLTPVPACRSFRRQDDRVKPQQFLFDDAESEEECILQALKWLKSQNIETQDIVFLSFRKDSFAKKVGELKGYKFVPFEVGGKVRAREIQYSTVHAFKGLEAPAVVLTDLSTQTSGFMDLLYVGMTRPTDRLAICAGRQAIAEIVEKGLEYKHD